MFQLPKINKLWIFFVSKNPYHRRIFTRIGSCEKQSQRTECVARFRQFLYYYYYIYIIIIIIILSYYFVCIIFLVVLENFSKNNFEYIVSKNLSLYSSTSEEFLLESNEITTNRVLCPIFVLLLLYYRIILYVLFFLPPTLNAISSFFYFSRSFRKCFNFQK